MSLGLNAEQQRVLDAVRAGKSAVAAGPAGSGKSHLIRVLRHVRPDAVVTATTGLAATGIGGVTIHKFAGIGIADPGPHALATDDDDEYIAKAVRQLLPRIRVDVRRSIKQTQLLVIDEVSMLSEYLARVLYELFQQIRRNRQPWGGIQVVAVGDMRQLAPVAKARDHPLHGRFFFEAPNFDRMFRGGVHILHRIYRQQSGPLQDLLNRVAIGQPTEEDKALLRTRVIDPARLVPPHTATWLYGKKETVSCYNSGHLASIDKPSHTYKMTVTKANGATDSIADWAVRNCIAEQFLTVKEGAYVMLLWNMEPGFANGTVGFIVGYTPDGYPLFQKKEAYGVGDMKSMHEVIAVRPVEWEVVDHAYGTVRLKQVPLKLAYALTIHKAQGIQVDEGALAIDRKNCFAPGQAYVAMSRLTTLEGMYLTRFDPDAIRASPAAIAFYDRYSVPREDDGGDEAGGDVGEAAPGGDEEDRPPSYEEATSPHGRN